MVEATFYFRSRRRDSIHQIVPFSVYLIPIVYPTAGIRGAGASHLRLSTGADWLRDIAAFVAERRHLAAYR